MKPGKGGRYTKRQEQARAAREKKLLRAAGVHPEVAETVVETRGAVDAAAIDRTIRAGADPEGDGTVQGGPPPGPSALPTGEPSPEELQAAGYYYKALFDLVALLLNVPELRVTDAYLDQMDVRRPAALVIRKRFPHGAEPETQLLVASAPHLMKGGQAYAARRAQALRAMAERAGRGGGDHSPRPGIFDAIRARAGNGGHAPAGEPARPGEEGVGQDVTYEEITSPVPPGAGV